MNGHKKPTALKLLAGNPGKRPLNAAEPSFAPSDLSPPSWLDGEGLALWPKLAAALDANGMFNEANRDVLAGYCDLWSTYIGQRLAGEGPDLKVLHQIRLIAREFGFTPSSQASVSAPGKAKEDNGKARFFG
ncbi:hypothetical protein ACIOWK_28420 [Pseudomonas protegens]|uniref:P27 family phage terminase small subunit n=1 Tax=Pseudomonas protegens TaxID=380021 RepID=UPI00381D48CC